MNRTHFLKQLDFEAWANKLIIKSISETNNPDERVYEIVSHLLIASNNWLNRIVGKSITYQLWETLTLEDSLQLSQLNHEAWKNFIMNQPDTELKQHVFFQFMGAPSKISIEDLLTHLINHSSYHRGQIIAKLKGQLEPLPLTTFIAFATEKA
jgi:uncharacterized damage-inducible protein DinB